MWAAFAETAEPMSHYPTSQVKPMLETNQSILFEFNYSKRCTVHAPYLKLEMVFTRAVPAFHNLFTGCVFNILHCA